MLRTQIAAAIGCARGHALDEIMREVWTRHGAGELNDDEAGQLSALAHERRAVWRGSGQGALGLVFPPPAERCPTPVRRRSHFKGRSEGQIWRPTTRKDVQAILKAAEIYNEAGLHKKGERSGPLGSVALDVLRLFVNLIDFRTGRLEPSITTIMDRLGRSRDTIVRALKNLRAHGFIDWLRRYEPTGNDGRGPQVQQASNACPCRRRHGSSLAGSARPLPRPTTTAPHRKRARLSWRPTGRPCPLMSWRCSRLATTRWAGRSPPWVRWCRNVSLITRLNPHLIFIQEGKHKRSPLFGLLTQPCGG